MRTTLTLDSDVAQELKALRKEGHPFKKVVNEALRLGLQQIRKSSRPRRYRTRVRDLGLRRGFRLDKVGELLARADGQDWR